MLFIGYAVNAMDRTVLSVLLESIKHEFHATDTQLGFLGGLAFALLYATLGIPIATLADRSNRRNVLAAAVALWTLATAACGLAMSYVQLLFARVLTAVGEAGGTPPSHSLLSDYFPLDRRGTALAIYSLGIPIGNVLGNLAGGWVNQFYGWRAAFIAVGLPGVLLAVLIKLTVREPPRGHSEAKPVAPEKDVQTTLTRLSQLWSCKSFRHIAIASAVHSFAWYGGVTWNAPYLSRSYGLSSGHVGTLLASFSAIGAIGTFFGGYIADHLSKRRGDYRWYTWVPAYATLAVVPLQYFAYSLPPVVALVPLFGAMAILSTVFLGPSFAMAQALASVRTRALAAALLLFLQTMIGLGIGPLLVGMASDYLAPTAGSRSLAYALVFAGVVNIWATFHFLRAARTLREDLRQAADRKDDPIAV